MNNSQASSSSIDIKIGAIGLILGSFLNMIRMGPIYLDPQIGFAGYPPQNLLETIDIAQRSGYYVSHAMVFFATPLFMIGFYVLYKQLKNSISSRWLTLSLFGFFIGQLLYIIGVVLHGLVLPELANDYVTGSASYQAAMAPLFDFTHHMATSYGGLGFAFILVSTGIFGVSLRQKHSMLGVAAMLIGLLAIIGYGTGILDLLLFESFMLTAGFVTAMFVLYFIIGIAMLRSLSKQD